MRSRRSVSFISRTSTPSTRIRPDDTSKNLGIRFTSVLFPLPVLPINATVSPLWAEKSISVSVSSSAPGYENPTCSKRTSPFAPLSGSAWASPSRMETFVPITSLIRFAATLALGSIIDIMVIIRKDIMICIAYCINAIIFPTCMVPLSTACAPL